MFSLLMICLGVVVLVILNGCCGFIFFICVVFYRNVLGICMVIDLVLFVMVWIVDVFGGIVYVCVCDIVFDCSILLRYS